MTRISKNLDTKEKARSCFESSYRPIYIADENKKLTYVNNAMCNALGYNKQELLQMELHQIIKKESLENILLREKKEFLDKGEINETIHFLTREGKEIIGDVKIVPIFLSDKKIIGSRAIFHNPTNVKKYTNLLMQSKERYQTLVENLPVGIGIISEDGRIVSANNLALETFGYDLKDLDWLTTSHLYSNFEEKDILPQKITSGELIWNHHIKLKKKDGSKIYILLNVKPILYSDGNYFLAAFNEITDIKKNYKGPISNKENPEDNGKPVSDLLAQIAYKIRTPIIIILNLNEAIRYEIEYKVDSETRSFFEEIESASKRILRIVDLILEMSTLESGNYEIKRKRIDLNKDILKKLYHKFKPIADEKGIIIKFTPITEETTIIADEFSIIQIFSYLIENAIRYTDKGEIEIIINKDKSNNLHISINDTGIGMTKDYITNLFNLFSQEKPDLTGRNERAGLALALVKKYCELNGAAIYIESGKGTGSRFTVSFNLRSD